jgi:hydrogenase maturation protein HypF
VRERLRLEIRGAVQGVGFRPFVYHLAHELRLDGWVLNDTRGLVIEVEGEAADLGRFRERLRSEKPAPAAIQALETGQLAAQGERGFRIRASRTGDDKTTQLLPDLATCSSCRRELFDPRDRRHGYAFGNCTRCGPRFSIILSLP